MLPVAVACCLVCFNRETFSVILVAAQVFPAFRSCAPQCKARLGAIVHKKTATALALTAVKNEVGPPARLG